MTPMRILVINANPVKDSFGAALSRKYFESAQASGADVHLLNLVDLNYNPLLLHAYAKEQESEPDLLLIRKLISRANHLVFVFPNWWGTYPAILKGFIDRAFVPGFAFRYRDGSLRWDKLLRGKSARLIITMDTPKWYYHWVYRKPAVFSLKRSVLGFCGIAPVRVTIFSPVKRSTPKQRLKWLSVAAKLGSLNR